MSWVPNHYDCVHVIGQKWKAITVPLDGTAFNLTLKLTNPGAFMLDGAILRLLRKIWGFGDDTWVDHTWVNHSLKI